LQKTFYALIKKGANINIIAQGNTLLYILSIAKENNKFNLIVKSSLHLSIKDDYSVVLLVKVIRIRRVEVV